MKRYIIFIILAVVLIAGSLLWQFGLYPVASVNGDVIYAREVDRTTRYIQNISGGIERLAGDQAPESLPEAVSPQEARNLAFEEIINQHIVDDALAGMVKSSVLEQLIEEELVSIRANSRFREAAINLYGENFKEIEKYILIPQVKRDILMSRLFLSGEDFQSWLSGQKEEADIKKF